MIRLCAFVIALLILGTHAFAQTLPRFATLHSSEVNMRTGPGERFPIEWVYKRSGFPVEILDEFEHWRKIRDVDGIKGWVHKKMLGGERTAMTPKDRKVPVYKKENAQSPIKAYLEDGVIVTIQKCPAGSPFCRVTVQTMEGWILRADLWGVYANEDIS